MEVALYQGSLSIASPGLAVRWLSGGAPLKANVSMAVAAARCSAGAGHHRIRAARGGTDTAGVPRSVDISRVGHRRDSSLGRRPFHRSTAPPSCGRSRRTDVGPVRGRHTSHRAQTIRRHHTSTYATSQCSSSASELLPTVFRRGMQPLPRSGHGNRTWGFMRWSYEGWLRGSC